jgi:hypothetical protein
MFNNSQYVGKKVAPSWAIEPSLVACLREGLTGEARTKDVVPRNIVNLNFTDIASRLKAEVLLIQPLEIWVDLACEYGSVTESPKGEMEASQPSE